MRIPYVIDNQEHRLSDVLNYLLGNSVHAVDIATAYFSIEAPTGSGRAGRLSSFRLLLGAEPTEGADVGCGPPANRSKGC